MRPPRPPVRRVLRDVDLWELLDAAMYPDRPTMTLDAETVEDIVHELLWWRIQIRRELARSKGDGK